MRKRQRQKGFTLLEAVLALLLFALLMESLWGFFATTYTDYTRFDGKAKAIDQARVVSDFIREEIRLSEKIKIEVLLDDGRTASIDPEDHTAITGSLKKIQLHTEGLPSSKASRELVLEGNGVLIDGKEMYRLIYQAPPITGPWSLISGEIEEIKVTRDEDSSLIQFECTFYKNDQKVQIDFAESVQYKERY